MPLRYDNEWMQVREFRYVLHVVSGRRPVFSNVGELKGILCGWSDQCVRPELEQSSFPAYINATTT